MCNVGRSWLGGMLALLATPLIASPLKRDEVILFVPSVARDAGEGRIHVPIEAWVHEHEPRRGAMRLFARWLDLDLDTLTSDERERFVARTQLFRVDSERGKSVRVRFADGSGQDLSRTRDGGRSRAEAEVATQLAGADGRIDFEAVLPPGDPRRIVGHAWHVPATGLSVVSDIDDTIKHSQVRDRRELLLNTFLRPFGAAPGMVARYRELAAARDTRFHYVSSSPLQLLPALDAFLADSGFPAGSLHLRETTSLLRVLSGGADSQRHKRDAISRLLADFPQRRFILVGDSGEHDPEIYAELARHHPDQIVAIGIRNVSAEPRDAPRYASTFTGLDASRWDVFDDPAAWQPVLPTR